MIQSKLTEWEWKAVNQKRYRQYGIKDKKLAEDLKLLKKAKGSYTISMAAVRGKM